MALALLVFLNGHAWFLWRTTLSAELSEVIGSTLNRGMFVFRTSIQVTK